MPLLHIHLNQQSQTVKLMHDLKPQTLFLRQIIINKDIENSMNADNEGLTIDLHHMFNGFEIMSNISSDNKLFIPVHSRALAPTPDPFIYPFHIKLNAEEIKREFLIECFKKDGKTPISFEQTGPDNDGHYKTIDLYFEYQTAQHFETLIGTEPGFHSAVGQH